MGKNKKPSRWAPYNKIDLEDADRILDYARLDHLAKQPDIWLDKNGREINDGIIVDISNLRNTDIRLKNKHIRIVFVAADTEHKVTSVEVDDIGFVHIFVDPPGDIKNPPKLKGVPVFTPELIANLRRSASNIYKIKNRKYQTATGYAHHVNSIVAKSLSSRSLKYIYDKLKVDTSTSVYQAAEADIQTYTADGKIHDGQTVQIAGRHYAILPAEDNEVIRQIPLFTMHEIASAREKNGILFYAAQQIFFDNVNKSLYHKAGIERFIEEHPHAYDFLIKYNGPIEFLKNISSLLKRGISLSDAQQESVTRTIANIIEKENSFFDKNNITGKSHRLTVEIIENNKLKKRNPQNPEKPIFANKIVMKDTQGRILIANSTSYEAKVGEIHNIMFQVMSPGQDRYGNHVWYVSQLHKLDANKELIRKKRPTRYVNTIKKKGKIDNNVSEKESYVSEKEYSP